MTAPFALGAAELLVDAAMYEAKAAGGGVNVYGDGTVDPLARLELPRGCGAASSAASSSCTTSRSCGSPITSVIGVESLVRWRDPARQGLVGPLDSSRWPSGRA